MRTEIFGKGETEIIDRKKEIFPGKRKEYEMNSQNSKLSLFRETFHEEYFYTLRKIFHTFMFDMKEFAIDFYGIEIEEFIQSLMWLTYVQVLVYEMDLNIELSGGDPRSETNLSLTGRQIHDFLREHDLYDEEIGRCIDEVVDYLRREREDADSRAEYRPEQIYQILELKSSDLELLRRIILKTCGIYATPEEVEIFKLLDKIREIFDDIRDYEEDHERVNFNTIIYMQKSQGGIVKGVETSAEYIDSECKRLKSLIDRQNGEQKEKFLQIYERLITEKDYYIGELLKLPKD